MRRRSTWAGTECWGSGWWSSGVLGRRLSSPASGGHRAVRQRESTFTQLLHWRTILRYFYSTTFIMFIPLPELLVTLETTCCIHLIWDTWRLLLKFYLGDFHFFQSNILTLYLYFYSSMTLEYILQRWCSTIKHTLDYSTFDLFRRAKMLKNVHLLTEWPTNSSQDITDLICNFMQVNAVPYCPRFALKRHWSEHRYLIPNPVNVRQSGLLQRLWAHIKTCQIF